MIEQKHIKRNSKKTIYIDMDGTLVNFQSGIDKLPKYIIKAYDGRLDEVDGIFSLMSPMDGAIEAYNELDKHFNVYILSTAPWGNPSAWTDKLMWVKKYLPSAYKNLILSHQKHLNVGEYLIDDRHHNGALEFKGELIEFGGEKFPAWSEVVEYLLENI